MGMAEGTPQKATSRGFSFHCGLMPVRPYSWPHDGFHKRSTYERESYYQQKTTYITAQFWRLYVSMEIITIYKPYVSNNTAFTTSR